MDHPIPLSKHLIAFILDRLTFTSSIYQIKLPYFRGPEWAFNLLASVPVSFRGKLLSSSIFSVRRVRKYILSFKVCCLISSSYCAAPRTPQCWRSSRSPWSATSPSAPLSTSSPSQTSRGPPLSASSAGPSPLPPLSLTSSLLRSTISTYRIIQETSSANLPSVRCLMKTSTPR